MTNPERVRRGHRGASGQQRARQGQPDRHADRDASKRSQTAQRAGWTAVICHRSRRDRGHDHRRPRRGHWTRARSRPARRRAASARPSTTACLEIEAELGTSGTLRRLGFHSPAWAAASTRRSHPHRPSTRSERQPPAHPRTGRWNPGSVAILDRFILDVARTRGTRARASVPARAVATAPCRKPPHGLARSSTHIDASIAGCRRHLLEFAGCSPEQLDQRSSSAYRRAPSGTSGQSTSRRLNPARGHLAMHGLDIIARRRRDPVRSAACSNWLLYADYAGAPVREAQQQALLQALRERYPDPRRRRMMHPDVEAVIKRTRRPPYPLHGPLPFVSEEQLNRPSQSTWLVRDYIAHLRDHRRRPSARCTAPYTPAKTPASATRDGARLRCRPVERISRVQARRREVVDELLLEAATTRTELRQAARRPHGGGHQQEDQVPGRQPRARPLEIELRAYLRGWCKHDPMHARRHDARRPRGHQRRLRAGSIDPVVTMYQKAMNG